MALYFTDSTVNGFGQENALSMLTNTGKDCSDIPAAGSINYSRAPDEVHYVAWRMSHKSHTSSFSVFIYMSHFYSSDCFISSPLLNTDSFLIQYYLNSPSPPPSPPHISSSIHLNLLPICFSLGKNMLLGDNNIT